MESRTRQAFAHQVLGQCTSPGGGAAKPDAAIGFQAGLNLGKIKRTFATRHASVQANAGFLTQRFKLIGKVSGLGRAVEKISINCGGWITGPFIQFGQKRRDTNTASDPDLGFFKNVAPQGY